MCYTSANSIPFQLLPFNILYTVYRVSRCSAFALFRKKTFMREMLEQAVHTGRLYRFKKSGGGRWKECWMVLLSTGQLLWYTDKQCAQLGGSVDLRNSLQYILIGKGAIQKYGSKVPKPPLDFGGDNFLAVPAKGGSVQWLYTKTEKDLAGWVGAFASVIGRSTAYEIAYDKHRKVQQPRDLRRAPSGDDDAKYRRLGLSIRAADTKDAEKELSQPEIDWGTAWQEILSSKIKDSKKHKSTASKEAMVSNGAPGNMPADSIPKEAESQSSSGADTWDLPTSEEDQAETSNALLDEVMTVVADVHSSEEEVLIEKF